ncbi:transcriptional regulator, LacI family [Curtobacterium sp. UNCCL20]|uniref:LacI family DNA-binding transcriptional regulator n=1 Tax=Curtobacterium sp. UNCCL20 TaxID=1502773 RepID=UPI0008829DCE|nr:LacI family DNA-binding transcriptional regulator [Curtobacterium sp. UNCCL20]SDQ13556.1 transcriptional regulator, LacI family [Curtobacterium sp. UNCCL20]
MTTSRRTSQRRVTSTDVARAAGVSRATVSYVLNATPNQSIPAATRNRVQEAADRLGYIPSAHGRALRQGLGETILVLEPDWMPSSTSALLWSSMSTSLAQAGLVCVFSRTAGAATSLRQVLTTFVPRLVLSFVPISDDDAELLAAQSVPLLRLDVGNGGRGGDHLELDEHIGRAQVEHLVDVGRSKLAYLDLVDERAREQSTARAAGAEAAAAAGLGVNLARLDFDFTTGLVESSVRQILDGGFDGVCCFNDDVALVIMARLRAAGRSVPDEVAVIGADDLPVGAFAAPPLTTVSLDNARIGHYIALRVATAAGVDMAGAEPDRDAAARVHVVHRRSS